MKYNWRFFWWWGMALFLAACSSSVEVEPKPYDPPVRTIVSGTWGGGNLMPWGENVVEMQCHGHNGFFQCRGTWKQTSNSGLMRQAELSVGGHMTGDQSFRATYNFRDGGIDVKGFVADGRLEVVGNKQTFLIFPPEECWHLIGSRVYLTRWAIV